MLNRHSEALAEESLLKGTRLLRHYGSKKWLKNQRQCHGEDLKVGSIREWLCHHAELVSASVRGETLKRVQGDNTFVQHAKGVLKKCAFTLSEVLVVLAVLGVVAAVTIPDLIQDYQERATVTALKKNYSVLQQAIDLSVAQNGPIETWNWGINGDGLSARELFRENIKPYLRVSKDCGIDTGCWYNGYVKNLRGESKSASPNYDSDRYSTKALLLDGTSLLFSTYGACNKVKGTSTALQHVCGRVYVDITGYNAPNMFGKDVFAFYITTEGIIPFGTATESVYHLYPECSPKIYGAADCGLGCAAWVIKRENMDYLRKTVSW